MYKVNLWQFERGKPLLGGLSVADTEDSTSELQADNQSASAALRGDFKLGISLVGSDQVWDIPNALS